ncbi:MAG: heat-inducible transcriptional repressor HrcA [Gammaproteobacteria bacterium]|nr:heat-inducible transcriptional repressor HrcA [Gammaproteobacteria bacterium]
MSESELNDRAQHLLKALVEKYIKGGQPVGSQALARESGINLSPATIRNVLSDLESLGLVSSPHTSAGRVPTDQGYRLFVDSLLNVQPLNNDVVCQLEEKLGSDDDPQDLIHRASTILSSITNLAGIVTIPKHEYIALRHIEFLPLSQKSVLVVIVINENEVHNKIINTPRAFNRSELEQAANYLNAHFAGTDIQAVKKSLINELKEAKNNADEFMTTAINMASQALNSESESKAGDYILDGEINLMNYAEMSDLDKLRLIFEAFNKKRDVLHLFDQVIRSEGVQIFIGAESGYTVFGDCSVVTSPYKVDGKVLGVLGVIGPTRIAYDKVIPVVDVTAKLLGAALNHQK